MLRRIDLLFDTMGRKNRSTIRISLFEDATTLGDLAERTPFASWMHDASEWGSNPQISLDLAEMPLQRGRTYGILIKSSGGALTTLRLCSASAPAIRLLNVFFLMGMPYLVRSACVEKDSAFRPLFSFRPCLSFSFLAGSSPVRDYLLFSVCIGWLHIVAKPFPHPIDEASHHYKACCVSRMMPLESSLGKLLGNEVPDNFQPAFTIRDSVWGVFYEPEANRKSFWVNPHLSHTIPVGHAVLAVPLAFSRFLSVPVRPSILLGRFFNYLVYVLLCVAAIRFSKSCASFFATASLLPMEQWLAGSFSTDPLICGGAFLFAGIVCGTRQKDG